MACGKWVPVVPGLIASLISPPGLKPCPMVLVFGCRQSRIDHIYKEETLFAKTQGVFRELYTAYSREPDKPKVRGRPCSGPGVQPWVAVASRHGVEMLVPSWIGVVQSGEEEAEGRSDHSLQLPERRLW